MGEAWREALQKRNEMLLEAWLREEEEIFRAFVGWHPATESIAECYR